MYFSPHFEPPRKEPQDLLMLDPRKVGAAARGLTDPLALYYRTGTELMAPGYCLDRAAAAYFPLMAPPYQAYGLYADYFRHDKLRMLGAEACASACCSCCSRAKDTPLYCPPYCPPPTLDSSTTLWNPGLALSTLPPPPRDDPPPSKSSRRGSAFVPVSRVPSPARYLPDETVNTPVQDRTVLKRLLASDPKLAEPTEVELLQDPSPPPPPPPPAKIKTEEEPPKPKQEEVVPSTPTHPEKKSEDSKTFRKRLLAKFYQQRSANGELTWRRALHRRRRLRSGLDMIRRRTRRPARLTNRAVKHHTPFSGSAALHGNKALGETPLHRAARQGYESAAEQALIAGHEVDPRDNAGYTPLHEACARGHLSMARLLLQHGADPNAAATGGSRPLHDAVESGQVEVVRLLLSYGADPTLANYSGLTPLKLARQGPMQEFLNGFMRDIGGDEVEDSLEPVAPWVFRGSASCMDPASDADLWADLPPDDLPHDELLFEVSSHPLLPTFRPSPGTEPSPGRWARLDDVLERLGCEDRTALLSRDPHLRTLQESTGCELVQLDSWLMTALGVEVVSLPP